MERLKNYIQKCGSKQIKLRVTARMISLLTLTNICQNILKRQHHSPDPRRLPLILVTN